MICFLVIVAVLIGVSVVTPGKVADPDNYACAAYATVFALLPPVVAIALALITKEVYSSLFTGIIVGALLYSNGNLELMMNTMFFNESGGMVFKLANSWNIGILIFLVMLGMLVALMNKAGGSAAFGKWASKRIKTRIGAQLATMVLGILIFVDDYFNCLTVGSVMRPVTDTHKVSRAKLSYMLDSLGCNLASFSPISSYGPFISGLIATELAAAGLKGNEWGLYIKMFPFNMYSLFAMIVVFLVAIFGLNIGPMYEEEKRCAETGEPLPEGLTPLVPEKDVELPEDYNLRLINFLLPMLGLFITIFATIFITGDIGANGLRGAFMNASITLAITMGFMVGSIVAGIVALQQDCLMLMQDLMDSSRV